MTELNPAESNLALAHRLRTAARSLVGDLHSQIESGVPRPRLNFRATDVTDQDRQAVWPRGVVVSRFRGTTILQLIARNDIGNILAAVEGRSRDSRLPGSDDRAVSEIRQIRTGVLLWNEHDNGSAFRPVSDMVPRNVIDHYRLVHGDETPTDSWTLMTGRPDIDEIDYASFDDAILDIGRHVDAPIQAEQARKLDQIHSALPAEDYEWAARMARTLTSRIQSRRDSSGRDHCR